jgi:hypothetical protein
LFYFSDEEETKTMNNQIYTKAAPKKNKKIKEEKENPTVIATAKTNTGTVTTTIKNESQEMINLSQMKIKKLELHEPYLPFQIDPSKLQNNEQSQITMRVVKNDNSPQNLVWLSQIKEVFSKQLPKMPKEYIFRLVFDQKHRCLVVLRNPSKEEIDNYLLRIKKNKKAYASDPQSYKFVPLPHKVLGGICFQPFIEQKFVEIVFLAITTQQQVKGYGTMGK